MIIPIERMHIPAISVISFVNLELILGTIGDMTAKAISGKLVKIPMLQFDRERLSRSRKIIGPT